MEKIGTVGWASQLLDSWKEALKAKKKTPKPPKVSFYRVRKVLRPVENATTVPSNKAMFRRLTKSRSDQQPLRPIDEKSATKNPLKPTLLTEKKRGTAEDLTKYQDSKRLKKDSDNSLNQYEQNLLDMYK